MKALKFIFVGLAILWTLIAILLSIGLALPVALITVWFKNKLFLNSMLLVVSKTLAIGLFPIGFLYKILKVLITSEARTEHLSKYLRTVAISDDQKGNVVCGPLFNDSMIHLLLKMVISMVMKMKQYQVLLVKTNNYKHSHELDEF